MEFMREKAIPVRRLRPRDVILCVQTVYNVTSSIPELLPGPFPCSSDTYWPAPPRDPFTVNDEVL
jgi:hypothetical protein